MGLRDPSPSAVAWAEGVWLRSGRRALPGLQSRRRGQSHTGIHKHEGLARSLQSQLAHLAGDGAGSTLHTGEHRQCGTANSFSLLNGVPDKAYTRLHERQYFLLDLGGDVGGVVGKEFLLRARLSSLRERSLSLPFRLNGLGSLEAPP